MAKKVTPKKLPDLVIPEKTAKSKALLSLKWKLKPQRVRGVCTKQGCNVKWSGQPGRIFCKKHKAELRVEQLRLNNIVWLKRVKAGTAGNHVIYGGKATKFSVAKPKAALKVVEAGEATVDVVEFKKILKAAPKQLTLPLEKSKKETKKGPAEKLLEKNLLKKAGVKPPKATPPEPKPKKVKVKVKVKKIIALPLEAAHVEDIGADEGLDNFGAE